MDHHHHHHHHHPHLHGHSGGGRYAPLPPQPPLTAPVFLDHPDPYRRQTHVSFPPQPPPAPLLPPPVSAAHHHHRLDDGGLVYVSYAPSSSHASDHGRFLAPADPTDRLVFKPPGQPPLPALRVSDRIIFPDGHPEAPRIHHQIPHHRRSGGGEVFVREEFKRERVRDPEEGQRGLPYGRREGEAVELREQEDVARRLGLLARKRPRWEEGRVLGEGALLECFEGRDPKRLSSGGSASRRHCDVLLYDLRAGDAESSRGPTRMYASERREAVVAFPRLPAEMPLRSSSGYSVSKMEFLENSKMMESETLALGSGQGFREKHLTTRCKRNVFAGEEEVCLFPKKEPQQKPSVLSRIQFAKPASRRKREQHIISTLTPSRVPKPSAFSKSSQLEMNGPVELDVSFKSDVLVAKEVLASPVANLERSTGEVCGDRTTKKNVAKDTSVNPGTSLPKSYRKVTIRMPKLKSTEEIFAGLTPDGKPTKGKTSRNKVANKAMASSSGVVQNFDDEVTCLRTPKHKGENQVSISLNTLQTSTDGPSPVKMTQKKMVETSVVPPDACMQNHEGKVTSASSPKRKLAKETLVSQSHDVMQDANSKVPTPKTIKKLSSDGTITMERCPEEKLVKESSVNSTDTELHIRGTVDTAKDILVAQKTASLHCSEKTTTITGSNKEVSEKIMFLSTPAPSKAEANTTTESPKTHPRKVAIISPSSVVNSDKKITTVTTLKKKAIKRNKKKNVVASGAPCLPGMPPSVGICEGHVSATKGTRYSKELQSGCMLTSSHVDQKYLVEGNKDVKHSEMFQKISTSDSSCHDLKRLEEVHAKFVSHYTEGMASTMVRSLKRKVIQRRNTEELTVIPCLLDPCPTKEICERRLNSSYENQMHSKEVQKGSLSDHFQKDLNCSEEAHKDTLYDNVCQDRLDVGEIQNRSMPASTLEDVEHLENVRKGSTQATTACVDATFQQHGEQQQSLISPGDNLTHSVLLERGETSDVGKPGANNSILEVHSHGIILPGYLETNRVEETSNTVVPMQIDTNGSPKKNIPSESALKNFQGSLRQENSTGEFDLNSAEGSGSVKHLSTFKEDFLLDAVDNSKVHNEVVALFEGECSLKADDTKSNGDGEKNLSLGSQASVVQGELEKDAATVLQCHKPKGSDSLQIDVQAGIPVLEEKRKPEETPAQGVVTAANKFGEASNEDSVVGWDISREMHAYMLAFPIEAQDAALDHHLLMGTNGQECRTLHLPFMDASPPSISTEIGVECPIVNPMVEQVADRLHSSPLSVCKKYSADDLATISEEMQPPEVKQNVCDLFDNENFHGGIAEKLNGSSNGKVDPLFDSKTFSVSEPKVSGMSNFANLSDSLIPGKTLCQPTQEAEKQQLNRNHQVKGKEKLTSICQRPGVSKAYTTQTSASARSFKKPPSHNVRCNTWHRTESSSVILPPGQMKWPSGNSLSRLSPKKLGKIQSSYIRKGNSLIRKSSSVVSSSHPHPEKTALDQMCGSETDKNVNMEDKIDNRDTSAYSNARTVHSSFERPKTPPLLLNSKSAHPSLNCPQTLTEDPLSEPGGEDHAIPSVGSQCLDLNEENHNIIVAEKSKVSDKKKMIYVKHGSNQLVAAPGTDASNAPVHATEESPALSFAPDFYYRNKNKLIRGISHSDGQLKQETSLSNVHANAKCHGSVEMNNLKGGAEIPYKTRLEKAMAKTYKQSRSSLVWTLNGTESQSKSSSVLKHRKVLPYLFPWKRATHSGGFFTKRCLTLNKHSSSLISRKLQYSRQQDTIYTVSNNGFSLRKSGVLSIGRSNLKWSKSMERRSRKASEEATLAIAEHERKKKKQKGTSFANLTMNNGNCSQRKLAFGIQLHQGECIVRVGPVLYKMDSSRRTLVRISDEQTTAVVDSQSAGGSNMPVVPRRLLIGNDEYIRVGNGNQLVRDPKKLVRILAHEKIRWSLHTVRLRSVKKQQYCQFFTRFGKCNKEDGKCPYIHDPTKVAICTKFLKGLCSSPNCKLTHKVIPERMPDCSYFLQGLCTNRDCPYRHVNVNPKASVCEGFLKGYCRDGDECRKKHSYVCPHFEASGKCPQGSACKLHHPKRVNKQAANKSRKRKRTPIQDHGRGRYFGCSVADDVGEAQVVASDMDLQGRSEDSFFHEGRFTEYISLDVDTDDDDSVEPNDPGAPLPTTVLMDSDLSDSQSRDADALIRPIRIMNTDPR